jgi:hypothetical protein
VTDGLDQILTGHLDRDGYVYYAGRERILFCEADSFGNITADLKARETWLREPAYDRPAPPKPRSGSREMWQLPPPNSVKRMRHHGNPDAEMPPTRPTDELLFLPWDWPAILTTNTHPNEDMPR